MNKRFEIRHPEKIKNQSVPMAKKPSWIKVKAPLSEGYKETKKIVKQNNLKILSDGEILKSQACIFSSRKNLKKKGVKKLINLLIK